VNTEAHRVFLYKWQLLFLRSMMVVNVRFVAVQFAELGFADRPLLGNRYGRLGHIPASRQVMTLP
jgi:hypothetical protein